ncbi:GIDE domain-containing protein [Halococcus hamelinensis]|uniref:RING-type E3 ubiquitin transferase n=1 Tax=Halococcus hamelinensis 100A6 TaxID=1132509 RepID=M0M5M6_9EURY|nr:GIDE domain-containing protein [Halococcus hamelinensis]EMA40991.1 hypothetical protein C447_03169 [Halococcus hamelinensis 100A6]
MVDLALVGVGLVVGVVGLVFAYTGWLNRKQRRLVTETGTTEVRGIDEEGRVEVKGEVDADQGVFTSPIGQSDAVLAAWEVEEWNERGDTSNWRTLASGVYSEPFHVDDGTGTVEVSLTDRVSGESESLLSLDSTVAGDGVAVDNVTCEFEAFPVVEEVGAESEPPEHVRSFVAGERGVSGQLGSITNLVDIGNAHGDRRYSERALGPGEAVYLLGHAEADADAPHPLHPEDVVLTAGNEEPFILSDHAEDALVDQFGSGYRRSLAIGVVLVVVGIAAVVAGTTPLL